MIHSTSKITIHSYNKETLIERSDVLAVEEPLEIHIVYWQNENKVNKNISITMRTPGNDRELSVGFLFTEGIILSTENIEKTEQKSDNVIEIHLKKDAIVDLSKTERNFYTSSSCGVCGKSSIESLRTVTHEHQISDYFKVNKDILFELNRQIREKQNVFESTGGLHASGLFNSEGILLNLFEDVGRHNALDKLIGSFLLNQMIPLKDSVLFLSGRASYELIQKAAMAGIPIICALGAPSSLAVELANEFKMTLIGFLKDSSFNLYSAPQRILMK